jgi:hypothetical protein
MMKCLYQRILLASWYKVKGASHKIFHELSVLTGPDYLLKAISKERKQPSMRGDYILYLLRMGANLAQHF